MIHLLLGPSLGTVSLYASDADHRTFAANGRDRGAAAGWMVGDVAVARVGGSAVVVGGTFGLDTLSYEVEDRIWNGASYTLGVDFGGRWTWGRGAILGVVDLRFGPRLRLGVADWSEGAAAVAGGGQFGLGLEMDTGRVRPVVSFAVAGTLSQAHESVEVELSSTTLEGYWAAGGVRALVLFGVAVGDPKDEGRLAKLAAYGCSGGATPAR